MSFRSSLLKSLSQFVNADLIIRDHSKLQIAPSLKLKRIKDLSCIWVTYYPYGVFYYYRWKKAYWVSQEKYR